MDVMNHLTFLEIKQDTCYTVNYSRKPYKTILFRNIHLIKWKMELIKIGCKILICFFKSYFLQNRMFQNNLKKIPVEIESQHEVLIFRLNSMCISCEMLNNKKKNTEKSWKIEFTESLSINGVIRLLIGFLSQGRNSPFHSMT